MIYMKQYSPISLMKPRISQALTVSNSSFNVGAFEVMITLEENVLLRVYSHSGNTIADLLDWDDMNK